MVRRLALPRSEAVSPDQTSSGRCYGSGMLPAGAPAGPPIDALGAALAKLVDREGDAELDSVERELASALEATPLDDAARAELVAVLVPLAVKAARRREHRHARRLLFHVLALTVGDPHDWLFEPRGPAAYRAPGDRITAFAALEAAVPTLEPLANAPDAVLPEVAEGSACSADRTDASLASTARLLCSFAQREELAEESAWRRACILVWGDEPVDAAATEAMARDPAEVPLVRAAAILRSGADAIAREVTPRAEVLALLAEVVTPMRLEQRPTRRGASDPRALPCRPLPRPRPPREDHDDGGTSSSGRASARAPPPRRASSGAPARGTSARRCPPWRRRTGRRTRLFQ